MRVIFPDGFAVVGMGLIMVLIALAMQYYASSAAPTPPTLAFASDKTEQTVASLGESITVPLELNRKTPSAVDADLVLEVRPAKGEPSPPLVTRVQAPEDKLTWNHEIPLADLLAYNAEFPVEVTVRLGDVRGADLGPRHEFSVTLSKSDAPPKPPEETPVPPSRRLIATLKANGPSVSEDKADSPIKVTIELDRTPTEKIVFVSRLDESKSTVTKEDFTAAPSDLFPGQIEFRPGELSRSFEIRARDDVLAEGVETLQIVIDAPPNIDWQDDKNSDKIDILDNDPIVVALVTYPEKATTLSEAEQDVVKIRVEAESPVPSDVVFEVRAVKVDPKSGSMAQVGEDFEIRSNGEKTNTVAIPQGGTFVDVELRVLDDAQIEPTESIVIQFQGKPGQVKFKQDKYYLGFYIESDDVPSIAWSAERAELREGQKEGLTLTATVNEAPREEVRVPLTLAGVPIDELETETGEPVKELVVPANDMKSRPLTLLLKDNARLEGRRELTISLSPVTGTFSSRVPAALKVTVLDDEAEGELLVLLLANDYLKKNWSVLRDSHFKTLSEKAAERKLRLIGGQVLVVGEGPDGEPTWSPLEKDESGQLSLPMGVQFPPSTHPWDMYFTGWAALEKTMALTDANARKRATAAIVWADSQNPDDEASRARKHKERTWMQVQALPLPLFYWLDAPSDTEISDTLDRQFESKKGGYNRVRVMPFDTTKSNLTMDLIGLDADLVGAKAK